MIAMVGFAQPVGTEVIHSRWGTTTHMPNALYRAMIIHRANTCKALEEHCYEDPQLLDIRNRREAYKATVRLPEVVSVRIVKAVDGSTVINLFDVDGNKSSIWTTSNGESLDVTGVEPY